MRGEQWPLRERCVNGAADEGRRAAAKTRDAPIEGGAFFVREAELEPSRPAQSASPTEPRSSVADGPIGRTAHSLPTRPAEPNGADSSILYGQNAYPATHKCFIYLSSQILRMAGINCLGRVRLCASIPADVALSREARAADVALSKSRVAPFDLDVAWKIDAVAARPDRVAAGSHDRALAEQQMRDGISSN